MSYPRSSEHDRTEDLVTDVPVGREVFSSDGDKLGVVDEVRGRSFKVKVRLVRDYWLSFDVVDTVSADRVTLTLIKDDVGAYKMEEPQTA